MHHYSDGQLINLFHIHLSQVYQNLEEGFDIKDHSFFQVASEALGRQLLSVEEKGVYSKLLRCTQGCTGNICPA